MVIQPDTRSLSYVGRRFAGRTQIATLTIGGVALTAPALALTADIWAAIPGEFEFQTVLTTSVLVGAVSMSSVEVLKRLTPLRAGVNRWILGGYSFSRSELSQKERLPPIGPPSWGRGSSSVFALEPERLVAQVARLVEIERLDSDKPTSATASRRSALADTKDALRRRSEEARQEAFLDQLTVGLSQVWRYGITSCAWVAAWVAVSVYSLTHPTPWITGAACAVMGTVLSWILRDVVSIIESRRRP